MIRIDLRKNSYYFPIQHYSAVFYKRDESVYCAVRTASSHRIQFTLVLKGTYIYCMVSSKVGEFFKCDLLGYDTMFYGRN